ncbi:hypothetical protein GCM10010156_48040 [Planobispora rosea]|uniref:N-acetyltransferase domain-containing protein n=1 Tax=Planobispora rosea TaxID=35762 RepID=A0A8J3S553_PLARO|nr:GNAT family N-acetyltransferase [Planobispora rosea]GGS83787.1 hypothetical protein GCM10010156_48040 [Planobispora rosea]GIH86305.1 hypothetical protein Pro02_47130 [Planobispora rosea]
MNPVGGDRAARQTPGKPGAGDPAPGEIREASAAELAALGETAGAALTLDPGEGQALVSRLAAPPPERRWTALTTPGLDGAVFVSVSGRDAAVGHIDLLAVHPGARGRGYGRALVGAAEAWLRAEGAAEARFAGNPPCYAWPGIDVRYTPAACLAESLGYERYHTAWNMTVDLAAADLSTEADVERLAERGVTVHAAGRDDAVHAAGPPLERATASAPADGGDRAAVAAFVRAHWKDTWAWEAEQASGCHYAARDGEILAFAAWGARPSWFGPMGTVPAARGLGLGRVLLRRCLAEMRAAGTVSAQISWVGPLGFYSRAVGARAERVFWLYRRSLR